MEVQPTTSFRLSSSSPVTLPPSEDDMAAWLYSIVSSQEPAVIAGGEVHPSAIVVAPHVAVVDDAVADHTRTRVRPPKMEHKFCAGAEDSIENGGSRKKATGGARRSHHAEKRYLTEKRRRRKINEKFKTLQRLVPGCDDKSNQTSTPEQTIRHIKLLQQIQAIMWFRCGGMKPAALYPPLMPPPYLPPVTGGAAAGCRPDAAASRPCSSSDGDGERARRPAAARDGSCTSTTTTTGGDGTFRAVSSTGASCTQRCCCCTIMLDPSET